MGKMDFALQQLQTVNDFLIMLHRVLRIVFVFINEMIFNDCSG